jgi:PD-(D/E)XK nuclease superfamily
MSDKLTVEVDSQILNAIDLCGQRYEYEHVLDFHPEEKDGALEHGSIMHDMLAHYYRNRMSGRYIQNASIVTAECLEIGRAAQAKTTNVTVEDFEEEDLPAFKQYVLHHQYDGWEIRFVENKFIKVLYDSDDLKIAIKGIVDLGIIRPKEGKAIVDHKTEKRRSDPFILSNQFQLYNWAFGEDIIINKVGYQKTLEAKEKFRRYTMTYSTQLAEEWRQDAIASIRRAIGWHKEGKFPRNRTSCDKFAGCIFRDICKNPPEVRESKLLAHFKRVKWDPWTRDAA